MNGVSSRHISILQRRIEYLTKKIEENAETDNHHDYDKAEVGALRAVLDYIDNEERNLIYKRIRRSACSKGQKHLLKFYKKTLKNAIHSGDNNAMEFLLNRTTEWLENLDDDNYFEDDLEKRLSI